MIMHVGMNVKTKEVKYADDVDLLAPDVHHARLVELEDARDLMRRVLILENNGYHVCVDRDGQFYETGEEQ